MHAAQITTTFSDSRRFVSSSVQSGCSCPPISRVVAAASAGSGGVAWDGHGRSGAATWSRRLWPERRHACSDSTRPRAASSVGLFTRIGHWNRDAQQLRDNLAALGLAGVVAYGLLNTAYYCTAFSVAWFCVIQPERGMGLQAATRKFVEVFAIVWAGSQVTKLLRAGGALALAPLVDVGMDRLQRRLALTSKQQAFAVIVAACLTAAAILFGAVVAVHS